MSGRSTSRSCGQLLKSTPGASFAYLTDFRPNDVGTEELVAFIKHVDVLVQENSYANQDLDLAAKNPHPSVRMKLAQTL
ncbi:MAG: hypothetical protein R3C56_27345 [Pirellulaceae bacterium]